MNLLGLIFSILVALTIAFSALFEKQISAERLRSTYVGHTRANREILKSYEQELYNSIKNSSHPTHSVERSPSEPREESKDPEFPKINPSCARLNIWPLVQEGRDAHPFLYEMTAKLLKTFYGNAPLEGKARSEYAFLDALLASLRAQEDPEFPLEKLPFANPAHRKLYYLMLKGTKECNLFQNSGYPALLDYLSFESSPSKPCLFHAHPHLTSTFFGPKVALNLFHSIHKKNGDKLSPELIQRLCSENHIFLADPKIFDFLDLKSCRNKSPITTFTGSDADTQISLRKEISFDRT